MRRGGTPESTSVRVENGAGVGVNDGFDLGLSTKSSLAAIPLLKAR